MEAYKQEFIEFMVDCQVLKFGEFTLKSGRKSPFFMNAGAYVTGSQLMGLGEYYAKAIHNTYGDDFDVLFGPAYKGIPISVVTAIAYSKLYGKEIRYCSDRKEEKDHGADKGSFLGSKLKDGDRVVMIEDVTTSGNISARIHKERGFSSALQRKLAEFKHLTIYHKFNKFLLVRFHVVILLYLRAFHRFLIFPILSHQGKFQLRHLSKLRSNRGTSNTPFILP